VRGKGIPWVSGVISIFDAVKGYPMGITEYLRVGAG